MKQHRRHSLVLLFLLVAPLRPSLARAILGEVPPSLTREEALQWMSDLGDLQSEISGALQQQNRDNIQQLDQQIQELNIQIQNLQTDLANVDPSAPDAAQQRQTIQNQIDTLTASRNQAQEEKESQEDEEEKNGAQKDVGDGVEQAGDDGISKLTEDEGPKGDQVDARAPEQGDGQTRSIAPDESNTDASPTADNNPASDQVLNADDMTPSDSDIAAGPSESTGDTSSATDTASSDTDTASGDTTGPNSEQASTSNGESTAAEGTSTGGQTTESPPTAEAGTATDSSDTGSTTDASDSTTTADNNESWQDPLGRRTEDITPEEWGQMGMDGPPNDSTGPVPEPPGSEQMTPDQALAELQQLGSDVSSAIKSAADWIGEKLFGAEILQAAADYLDTNKLATGEFVNDQLPGFSRVPDGTPTNPSLSDIIGEGATQLAQRTGLMDSPTPSWEFNSPNGTDGPNIFRVNGDNPFSQDYSTWQALSGGNTNEQVGYWGSDGKPYTGSPPPGEAGAKPITVGEVNRALWNSIETQVTNPVTGQSTWAGLSGTQGADGTFTAWNPDTGFTSGSKPIFGNDGFVTTLAGSNGQYTQHSGFLTADSSPVLMSQTADGNWQFSLNGQQFTQSTLFGTQYTQQGTGASLFWDPVSNTLQGNPTLAFGYDAVATGAYDSFNSLSSQVGSLFDGAGSYLSSFQSSSPTASGWDFGFGSFFGAPLSWNWNPFSWRAE